MSKKIDRTKGKRFGKKNTGRIYERNPMTGEIRSRAQQHWSGEKITTSAI